MTARPDNVASSAWRVDMIGAAICAAMTAVFWFAGIKPMVAHYEQRQQQQQELAVARQLAHQSERRVRIAQRQLTQINEQIDSHPVHLRPEDQLNQMLDELTTLIHDSSLQVDRVQSGNIHNHQLLRTMDVRLEGIGSYTHAAAFMHRLHTTCPDLRIRSLSLSAKDPKGLSASFELDLLWHMQPSGSESAPAAANAPPERTVAVPVQGIRP